MEDLKDFGGLSFKPYYKWITFNTHYASTAGDLTTLGFKPYYKWITFNTSLLETLATALYFLF